ncbi:MAG: hypothetical protein MHMPM18_005155 [Marteilia pararefringens]
MRILLLSILLNFCQTHFQRNCCGIDIGDELISKIQNIPLESICSICHQYLSRNSDINGFALNSFSTMRSHIQKSFIRMLLNSYDSSNLQLIKSFIFT